MKGGEGVPDWGALVPLAVHPTKVGIAEALRWIGHVNEGVSAECSAMAPA